MQTTLQNFIRGEYNKALFGMLAFMFLGYCFLIASTILSINERKNLYAEIRDKQAELSEREIAYFTLAQGIDMDTATDAGFVSATAVFAYTNPGAQDAVAVR